MDMKKVRANIMGEWFRLEWSGRLENDLRIIGDFKNVRVSLFFCVMHKNMAFLSVCIHTLTERERKSVCVEYILAGDRSARDQLCYVYENAVDRHKHKDRRVMNAEQLKCEKYLNAIIESHTIMCIKWHVPNIHAYDMYRLLSAKTGVCSFFRFLVS